MNRVQFNQLGYVKMQVCPHCNKEAFSTWRKLALGPAGVTHCRSCRAPISTSWVSVLAAVPFIGAIALQLTDLRGTPLGYAALVVAFAVYSVLHLWFVPLVRK